MSAGNPLKIQAGEQIDLHLHSTASDGILTPTQLVDWAKEKNLTTIAITDHDTVDGIAEAIAEGEKVGVRVIPGIEFSSFSTVEIHVLVYDFEWQNPEFAKELEYIKNLRGARNMVLLERLALQGVYLTESYGRERGRAHMAREMVKKGYAHSVNDAFDRYLGRKGSAYVVTQRLLPREAVEIGARFGGVPVLAHPKSYITEGTLLSLVDGLIPCGLRGIETYYPTHTPADVKLLEGVAARRNLITTRGSDMHVPF